MPNTKQMWNEIHTSIAIEVNRIAKNVYNKTGRYQQYVDKKDLEKLLKRRCKSDQELKDVVTLLYIAKQINYEIYKDAQKYLKQ